LREKPKGPPFHPGATGEGKTGRVNESESSNASSSAASEMEGSTGAKDWPLGSGRRQSESFGRL
jgi:hypothetical protein